MIGKVSGQQKEAYLFLCETLSEFVWQNMKKKPFDGARIVATPNQKYLISVLTLDATKYPVKSNMDKVASMKAKQMANTLLNGSTITSEQVLTTEEQNSPQITESIREQAMGFVQGIELLTTKENKVNFLTYIFYAKI
jgi:SLT domain-containing protein